MLLVLHFTYAAILSTFLVIQFSFHPILPRPLAANLYGWEQLVAAMNEAKAANNAAFIASDLWQHASKLAFTLDDPTVVAITPAADAYDQWFRPADYEGDDAIILADEDLLPYLRTRFESVAFLRTVEVTSWHVPVFSHTIYLGRTSIPLKRTVSRALQGGGGTGCTVENLDRSASCQSRAAGLLRPSGAGRSQSRSTVQFAEAPQLQQRQSGRRELGGICVAAEWLHEDDPVDHLPFDAVLGALEYCPPGPARTGCGGSSATTPTTGRCRQG